MYDYYCTSCGNKFAGENIAFDLVEFIQNEPVDVSNPGMRLPALWSMDEIEELADRSGTKFCREEISEIRVDLLSFLKHAYRKSNQIEKDKRMLEDKLACTSVDRVSDILAAFPLSIFETKFAVKDFLDKIKRIEGTEESEDRLCNYEAVFYLQPIYLSDNDEIYSFRFGAVNNACDLKSIAIKGKKIRGYCPYCGAAVIDGAGQYAHKRIGIVGPAQAGKTTLLMAMVTELLSKFDSIGVDYPGRPLTDEGYDLLSENIKKYKNGIVPYKTPYEAEHSSMATLKIKGRDAAEEKLVTLVDLPGERCFNANTESFNIEAANYPLSLNCDAYIMCIPASGNNEQDMETLSQTVFEIVHGLYAEVEARTGKRPPMLILITKADLLPGEQNETIKLKNRLHVEQSDKEYVKSLTCTALGLEAVSELWLEEGESREGISFKPQGMEEVWKCILQTIGVLPAKARYVLSRIPIRGERYSDDPADGLYPAEEAIARCKALQYTFENLTSDDIRVTVEEDKGEKGFIFKSTPQKRVRKYLIKKGLLEVKEQVKAEVPVEKAASDGQ